MESTAKYRPYLHFSPEKGWMNDPNGLIFVDGKYHLFYQHYPNSTHWGPMFWGHAVSTDLLHWEHLPIALGPDDLGSIFSGSAILDSENVSGFGTEGKSPMIVVYTNHSMPSKKEVQSIAWSTDYVNFTKFSGNPVVPGQPGDNSRDPKVFRNPVRGGFSFVLATEGCVTFYHSMDLKTWEKTGTFEAGVHGLAGICECPDCFPVETDEGTKWVLITSMILPEHELLKPVTPENRMKHMVQYYVGTFDGDRFIDTECADHALLLDYGTDLYAPVTFSGTEKPYMIGWADNWDYANQSPPEDEGFQGKMSLARELSLVKTEGGWRLCQQFAGIREARLSEQPVECLDNTFQGIPSEKAVELAVEIPAGGRLSFGNRFGESLYLAVTEESIILDRRSAGRSDFSNRFITERTGRLMIPRKTKGTAKIDLVLDHCVLEVLADDGLTLATMNVYPHAPYDRISLSDKVSGSIYELG